MRITLGNLTVRKMEDKHEFKLSDYDRDLLESSRQDDAQDIAPEHFHIFDKPMTTIVCGSKEIAMLVISIMNKHNSDIKGTISLEY